MAAILAGLSSILTGVAYADPLGIPPSYRMNVTAPGGVNAITGEASFEEVDLTAGVPDDPAAITFKRTYSSSGSSRTPLAPFGTYFSHNQLNHLSFENYSCGDCTVAVYVLGKKYNFGRSGVTTGAYINSRKDGAVLDLISTLPAVYRITLADGTRAYFEFSDIYATGATNIAGDFHLLDVYVKYIEFPNGQSQTFSYQSTGYINQGDRKFYVSRLESVINSNGYGLALAYVNPAIGGSASRSQRLVASASSFKLDCTPSCVRSTLSTVNYQYIIAGGGVVDPYGGPYYLLDQVRLPEDLVKHYTFDTSYGVLKSVRTANNTYYDIEYTYEIIFGQLGIYNENGDDQHQIGLYTTSVKDGDGKVTSFAYDYPTRMMTITQPTGPSYKVHSNWNPVDGNDGVSDQPVPDWTEDQLGRRTTYSYDSVDRLKSVTDSEGRVTSQILDDRENQLEWRRHPAGVALSNTSQDIVKTASYPSCTGANYRVCNQPEYTVDARGLRTDYAYDPAFGGLVIQLDPADPNNASAKRPVSFHYYGSYAAAPGVSPPTGITSPAVWLKAADIRCLSSSMTAGQIDWSFTCPANDSVTVGHTYSPDRHQLTSTVVDPQGAALTTSYDYDAVGNREWVNGPQPGNGDVTHNEYDALRRLKQVTEPTVSGNTPITKYTYDDYGHVKLTERKLGSGWVSESIHYNNRQLKDYATGVDGVTEYYSYYDDGALKDTTRTVDGVARVTRNIYYDDGKLKQIFQGVGTDKQRTYVTYGYSPNGKKIAETDANGNTVVSCYDGFDRLVELRFPSGSAAAGSSAATCVDTPIYATLPSGQSRESYGYDASGNMTSLTRRGGTMTIGMAYDGLNRMIYKDVPETDRDVTYVYDLAGRRTYAALPGANADLSVAWTYDNADRITGETNGYATVSHQYGPGGTWEDTIWPDGLRMRQAFDAQGQVGEIKEVIGSNFFSYASYGYDTLKRRTSQTFGNGAGSSWGYNGQQRLSSLQHAVPGGGGATWGFPLYNEAGQIRQTTLDNAAYSWTGAVNADRTYTVNALNQYNNAGAVSFTYDPRGNLTGDGSRFYSYDSDNRLIQVTGSTYEQLDYDAIGRLAKTAGAANRRFLYDGTEMVGEYDGSNLIRYVHGPGTDEPIVRYDYTGRHWLHADYHGSIVATSNGGGYLEYTNAYDEYGIEQVTNLGRFGYTGQARLPELGLMYYKARIYSPTLGRFLQTDPVGSADQVNLYAYVGNEPIDATDPTGADGDPKWEMATASSKGFGNFSCTACHSSPSIPSMTSVMAGKKEGTSSLKGTIAAAVGAAMGNGEKTVHVTYTKEKKGSGGRVVYSGRTSIRVPAETSNRAAGIMAVNNRDTGHHMDGQGFGPAIPDKTSLDYFAIRGREQQLIDFNGGARSMGGTSGNAINGISNFNPLWHYYQNAATAEFGRLPSNRPQ